VRTALRLAPPIAGATLVLAVLLPIRVLPVTRVLAIWVVLLTAIALRDLVRSFPPTANRKPRFEAVLRTQARTAPETSDLPRMERELELSLAYADHAHRKLLPVLRTAAAARLSMRHGIELERQPDAARRLLGEQTWDLVRPDRPAPADGLGPGPPEEDIAAVVARLESL
jgi:hypothetical protein